MAEKPDRFDVELHTKTGRVCKIKNSVSAEDPGTGVDDADILNEAASRWNNVVRNRHRWNEYLPATRAQREQCYLQLRELKVTKKQLERIAKDEIVEVKIPYETEARGWGARIMPWEYLISSAVRHVTQDVNTEIVVIRHLYRIGEAKRPLQKQTRKEKKASVVICAPETTGDLYDFSTEMQLVDNRLKITPNTLYNPTRVELSKSIDRDCPTVVHFAGFDTHQADKILGKEAEDLLDGVAMVRNKKLDNVPSFKIAKTLGDEKDRFPYLVVYNLLHSASRTAALSVAEGVAVSVGFQDTVDEFAAELFISEFYRAWNLTSGQSLTSFLAGYMTLHDLKVNKCGSGIVMWSERSWTKNSDEAKSSARAIVADVNSRRKNSIGFANRSEAKKSLEVRFKVKQALNYSLLHNGAPLFEFFTLGKSDLAQEGEINDVCVEIELMAGTDKIGFRTLTSVGDAGQNLTDSLFIPLTSNLPRTIREPIQTALRVKISIGSFDSILEETERVRLLPAREWVDDEQNWYFLPSFVFPSDPAVVDILIRAQKFLRAISDNPNAGFDGYQSIDEELAEQDIDGDPYQGVHDQVAAIWSALLEIRLVYVNPPPTYTSRSQRIRTPSDVIDQGMGTCIDLALLLTSCLEYIEIYPVMFLLDGHAFLGYWRSEEDWFEFMCMKEEELYGWEDDSIVDQPQESWLFNRHHFQMIYAVIQQGKLVPIEATGLTDQTGFEGSQDEGWDNFYDPTEFHSLIDIVQSRQVDRPVTPVPLGEFG